MRVYDKVHTYNCIKLSIKPPSMTLGSPVIFMPQASRHDGQKASFRSAPATPQRPKPLPTSNAERGKFDPLSSSRSHTRRPQYDHTITACHALPSVAQQLRCGPQLLARRPPGPLPFYLADRPPRFLCRLVRRDACTELATYECDSVGFGVRLHIVEGEKEWGKWFYRRKEVGVGCWRVDEFGYNM